MLVQEANAENLARGGPIERLPRPDGDRGVYGISVAAELAGMGIQNLRFCMPTAACRSRVAPRAGHDLDRLRRISDLLDAGLNLAGIGMVVDVEAQNTQLERVDGGTPQNPAWTTRSNARSCQRLIVRRCRVADGYAGVLQCVASAACPATGCATRVTYPRPDPPAVRVHAPAVADACPAAIALPPLTRRDGWVELMTRDGTDADAVVVSRRVG